MNSDQDMLLCALCRAPLDFSQALSFRDMPSRAQHLEASGSSNTDDRVDFSLVSCSGCNLLQLDCAPVPYYREVVRAAGISPEMLDFRRKQFHDFVSKFRLAELPFVEVGCGAGEYLAVMREFAHHAVGIEFGDASRDRCSSLGLTSFRYYPGESSGSIPGGPFAGFMLLNFLEHVPDLRQFLTGIRQNLRPGAVGLVEVPNADMILREKLAIEIMCDHLYYFTQDTLRLTLELCGFEVVTCSPTWHEYSLSAQVRVRQPPAIGSLMDEMSSVRSQFDAFLAGYAKDEVVVWGAGHQAFAALALNELGQRVGYIVDSAEFKQGRLSPASRIEIRSPEHLLGDPQVKAVVVMAGSYSDEVISRLTQEFPGRFRIAVLRPRGLEVLGTESDR